MGNRSRESYDKFVGHTKVDDDKPSKATPLSVTFNPKNMPKPPLMSSRVCQAMRLSTSRQCLAIPTGIGPRCSFSTTPRPQKIGPESPRFIDVPQPPQQTGTPKLRIKGILPVPRQVFARRAPIKIPAEHLAATTPEPSSTSPSKPPRDPDVAERVAWKRRLAASRRQNLREGLTELRDRKRRTEKAMAGRGAFRQSRRNAKLHRPQREDERLTFPSVTVAMKMLQTGTLPDPDREARIARKRANVAATMAKQSEKRKEALHNLYLNARDFITTEEALLEKIEQIFVEVPVEFGDEAAPGDSIWKRGAPPDLEKMLNVMMRRKRDTVSVNSHYAEFAHQRSLRLAEELTGGKLDLE